jgi:hypothetical protein
VILGDRKETNMSELLDLITAGAYFPALALGLVLATHALRRARVDAWLARLLDAGDVRWLRPWIPMTLASAAFAIAALTGAMDTAMAAAQSLAALVTAMAGHDAGQAVLALLRAVLGPASGPPPAGPGVGDPDEREPDEHLVRHEPRPRPAPDSIRRRLAVAETVVTALPCAVLLVGCIDPLGGSPAAGIEIVVERDFNGRQLAPGDAIYLHELPVGGGFWEAKYSRLYRGPLPAAAAGQEEYGAAEAMRPTVLSELAREHIDAITGIIFGEIQIPNSGNLYETLWWMLFAGAEYPAVLFDPLPGQPTPPNGMPITTYLLVCNTDEPDSRTCRSWPGAVQAGMAVCRDVATKQPISKSKCTILAPYTQWWVRGTPPMVPAAPATIAPGASCGYPLAMAIKTRAQELHEHAVNDARQAIDELSPEERREAEEWAESLRQANPGAEPDKRWDHGV